MKDVVLHLPGGCVSHWRDHSIGDAIPQEALGPPHGQIAQDWVTAAGMGQEPGVVSQPVLTAGAYMAAMRVGFLIAWSAIQAWASATRARSATRPGSPPRRARAAAAHRRMSAASKRAAASSSRAAASSCAPRAAANSPWMSRAWATAQGTPSREPSGVARGGAEQGGGIVGRRGGGQGGAGPEVPHEDPDELDPEQQRPRQRRPVPREQVPGRATFAAIEFDLDGRPELVVVLEMVARARPGLHHPADLVAGPIRLVGHQPVDGKAVGAMAHGRVEVAAFPRLLEQDRLAAAQLGDFSQVDQGPEREGVHGVEFRPGGPRAVVAEERRGAIAAVEAGAPAAFEISGDALR